MEEYLYRRAVYASRLQREQEQLQCQLQALRHPQQLPLQRGLLPDYQRLSHSLFREYGMDRRQIWGGGGRGMGLGASSHGGLLPFDLIEQDRRADVLRSALDCGELAPARLSYGLEAARDPKRAMLVEDQEIPRKKPRRKEFSEEEKAREVMLLHQLWKENKGVSQGNEERGRKVEKEPKVDTRRRNRKQRTGRRDKVQVKIDTSGKTADKQLRGAASNWEDHVPDANNKSWIEGEKDTPGESQAEGWVSDASALRVESQTAIRESAAAIHVQEKKPDVETAKPEVEDEKAHQSFVHVQKAAVITFKEFLGSDSDVENSDDEMDFPDSDDESDMAGQLAQSTDESQNPKGREALAYDFFVNLFAENQELRKLYEENCNCGAFECLVCAAIGTKLCKRFPDLVGLVQHGRKILKTKKRQEHRGYARAVCGLLGWDPLRDPVPARTAVGFRPRGCIPPAEEESQEENNVTARSIDPKEEEKSDEGKVVAEEGLNFDGVVKDENNNPIAENPYVKPSDSSVESSIAIEAQG